MNNIASMIENLVHEVMKTKSKHQRDKDASSSIIEEKDVGFTSSYACLFGYGITGRLMMKNRRY